MVIGAGASKKSTTNRIPPFCMPVGVQRPVRYHAAASTGATDTKMLDIVSGMNEIEGI
jgi:hypothetical protein